MVCVHYSSLRVEMSPYVYHTTGLAVSGFLREQGIVCSLYIDYRLNGELLTKSGPWSILYYDRQKEFGVKAARPAIFIVHSVLVELGYTIVISKSVLYPTTSLEYLGFLVDSEKQSFIIPQSKIVAWAFLQEKILACKKCVDVKNLQRFQGKCISLSLAAPAAKLFIREMSHAITTASSNGLVPLSQALRSELIHWRFLDTVISQKWHADVPPTSATQRQKFRTDDVKYVRNPVRKADWSAEQLLCFSYCSRMTDKRQKATKVKCEREESLTKQ